MEEAFAIVALVGLASMVPIAVLADTLLANREAARWYREWCAGAPSE